MNQKNDLPEKEVDTGWIEVPPAGKLEKLSDGLKAWSKPSVKPRIKWTFKKDGNVIPDHKRHEHGIY